MVKLAAAFPPSFAGPTAVDDKAVLWREDVVDANPWITPLIFEKGVRLIVRTVATSDYLPPPARCVDYFREAQRAVDRELERQRALAAVMLPPPPPTPSTWDAKSPDERRDFWDHNVAIGKVRQRNRIALIEAWRAQQGPSHDWHSEVPEGVWKGRDEPTDAQIEAVRLEMSKNLTSPIEASKRAYEATGRGGAGHVRIEWADGQLSDVTIAGRYDVPIAERAADPENARVLKDYEKTPPYNDREYKRDHPGERRT